MRLNLRKGYKALILPFHIKHKIIKSINQSIEEVNFAYFLQVHNVVDLSVKIILCVSFIYGLLEGHAFDPALSIHIFWNQISKVVRAQLM